jgi:hypothetical protein
MSDPLVSIVIDNYNYGRFLAAAIESALDQTYPRVEVVVVDDGSTDDSAEVIARYRGRIRALFQPNAGQSEAFHRGFEAANGDIVLFLDSDDALRPDAVATIVGRWGPGVSKAQWSLASVDAAGAFLGNVFPNFPPGLTGEDVRREVLRSGLYPCPPTSGNAYARWFLEKVLPVRVLRQGTDGPLNVAAPLYGEVVTIDRVLGYYRLHGANDGAQQSLAAEKFAKFITMDMARSAFLREHAGRLGLTLEGEPNDRAILHLQYRLASLKLNAATHPVAGETVADVTRLALAAAAASCDRLPSRVMVVGWSLAVALSPRTLARRLIAWRFVPQSRSALLKRLLGRLRIVRGAATAEQREEFSLPPKLAGTRPA